MQQEKAPHLNTQQKTPITTPKLTNSTSSLTYRISPPPPVDAAPISVSAPLLRHLISPLPDNSFNYAILKSQMIYNSKCNCKPHMETLIVKITKTNSWIEVKKTTLNLKIENFWGEKITFLFPNFTGIVAPLALQHQIRRRWVGTSQVWGRRRPVSFFFCRRRSIFSELFFQ